MKIIIDTEVLQKKKVGLDEFLYLFSLYKGTPITSKTFEKIKERKFLNFREAYNKDKAFDNNVFINETGKFYYELLISNMNIPEETSEDRFVKLAEKLREIFPAGKKPGYAYTWRDSVSCITDRLKKFFVKYDPDYQYTDEQIIAATKKYVDSFNGNYKYMQLLKYFIWKNKVTGGELIQGRLVGETERQSQLAAYLEDTEATNTTNDDWGVSLK